MTVTEAPPPPPPATWAELVEAVRTAGPGMYVTNMATLRNLERSRRTDMAQPAIMEALRERAVVFLPDPLPTRADALVALYQRGTEVGDFAWALTQLVRGESINRGLAEALTSFGARRADDDTLQELERVFADLATRGQAAREYVEQLERRGREASTYLERIRGPRR